MFDWDDNKNLQNIDKHGVSFEEASRAFSDPNRLNLFCSSLSAYVWWLECFKISS